MAKVPFRIRVARAIGGDKLRSLVPPLPGSDLWDVGDDFKAFKSKPDQLSANLNWSYAANRAIADPAAATELIPYRKNKQGDRVEAHDPNAEALYDLLSNPNNVHTWEQLAGLHYSYMNFTGEGYTLMIRDGQPWTPEPGKLPHALQELPAHQVHFKLSDQGYSQSTIRFNNREMPLGVTIRDLTPDPDNPYLGMSVIRAAASIINSDLEMRNWNNRLMANGASPSVVFTSNEPMDEESYQRWKQQFQDEHSGSVNAGKPLLIEGGDVKPFMLTPRDLDFLASRQFTRDEILAMWRVSPYMIGSVEDVNLATAKATRIQHAEINIEPRVRQWVRQLNATMVSVFDPGLELGYPDDIVPTDEEAKMAYHVAAVNKWESINEARADYGEQPLPDRLGEQIVLPNTNAPLSAILDGSARPAPVIHVPGQPEDKDPPDGTNEPQKDDKSLALIGVKKKT